MSACVRVPHRAPADRHSAYGIPPSAMTSPASIDNQAITVYKHQQCTELSGVDLLQTTPLPLGLAIGFSRLHHLVTKGPGNLSSVCCLSLSVGPFLCLSCSHGSHGSDGSHGSHGSGDDGSRTGSWEGSADAIYLFRLCGLLAELKQLDVPDVPVVPQKRRPDGEQVPHGVGVDHLEPRRPVAELKRKP